MKILLVNDNGQTMAQMDEVEKYDVSQPGHTAGLLDLLEALIDSAKSSQGGIVRPAVLHLTDNEVSGSRLR